jgi:TfoX/Sxy family transcriptional regulator of competence genes
VRSAKSSTASHAAFRAVVPANPGVTVRPMFGSLAAFAGGQMFMCLFADELYVRLGEADRANLMAAGGEPFEPMPGRPMREYVSLPDWQAPSAAAREWSGRALAYALSLGPRKR